MKEDVKKRGLGDLEPGGLKPELTPVQMATALGWRIIRRTMVECDVCERDSSPERRVWLVALVEEKTNRVKTLCERCLRLKLDAHMREQAGLDAHMREQAGLDAHMREQAGLDALVEAVPHEATEGRAA